MPKEFKYRGKTPEEMKKMTREDLAEILPARQRRTLKRGLTKQQEKVLSKLKEDTNRKEPVKTHIRDLPILPEMFGKKLSIHNGKQWKTIEIKPSMIGHYIGDFALTRSEAVKHSGPGIGATRGTKYMSVR